MSGASPGPWLNPSAVSANNLHVTQIAMSGVRFLDVESKEAHGAVYTTRGGALTASITLAVPDIAMSSFQRRVGPLTMTIEVCTYAIATSNAKHPKKDTGYSAELRGGKYLRNNTVEKSSAKFVLPVQAEGMSGRSITCDVALPDDVARNIGAVDVVPLWLHWEIPADPAILGGPTSAVPVDSPVLPCERASTPQPEDVVAVDVDEAPPSSAQRRARLKRPAEEPLTDDRATSMPRTQRTTEMRWKIEPARLTVLRTVAEPLPNSLQLDNDVTRFEPFVSFKHMFHACVWANQSAPNSWREPHGLVYHVVQNVRLYHDGWLNGESTPAGAIPYPPDQEKDGAAQYDTQNEGWNVLDNPVPLKRSGQCNQVGTLMVDVLAALGVPASVIDIRRVYHPENGRITVRQLLKGSRQLFNLHGVLCVDYPDFDGDWCYDTTMSQPPNRWFGTIAKACEHFGKFDGEWRYVMFDGKPVDDALQADVRVLGAHIPPDKDDHPDQNARWDPGKGNVRIGDKERAKHEKARQEVIDADAQVGRDAAAARKEINKLRIAPKGCIDLGEQTDGKRHFAIARTSDGTARIDVEAQGEGDLTQVAWAVDGSPAGTGQKISVGHAICAQRKISAAQLAEKDEIVLWTFEVQLVARCAGDLPVACTLHFDKLGHGQIDVEPRRLGIIADQAFDPDKNIMCKAVGRMVAAAKLLPPGVGAVMKSKWKIRRFIAAESTWTDGVLTTKTNENDERDQTARTQALTPNASDEIYFVDLPNITRFGDAEAFIETYMNFEQWVEYGGIRCSPTVQWMFWGAWVAYGGDTLANAGVVPAVEDYEPRVFAAIAAGHVAIPGNPRLQIEGSDEKRMLRSSGGFPVVATTVASAPPPSSRKPGGRKTKP